MSRILVVGGYGGFGGRLSRRLALAGHQVIVGGRSRAKAKAFCASQRNFEPAEIDRERNPGKAIGDLRPDLVIDAAGPFQGSDYGLARACIAAGVHYLDLADARDFVSGISALDEEARQAGVCVISGASSVPALSHAIVAHLGDNIDRISAVEIAISASSRASAGDSVAKAILGGVGQPLRLWQGRRWVKAHGWQSIRCERMALASGKSIGRRWVALADVPDLQSLPNRLPGVSAVAFRAGTESAVASIGLWAASLLVRSGLMRSLAPVRKPLVQLHRLSRLWGGDRSGMLVRLFGEQGQRRVERRWTLIAEQGDGPEIPTLAAAILADRVTTGAIRTGARDAGGLVSLSDFEPAFAGLAIAHETTEFPQLKTLYGRVMGAQFDALSPAVRAIHGVLRDSGAAGEAKVGRGESWIARGIAAAMRFPPAGAYPVHVHFEERDGVERWTRDFGGHRFTSQLREGKPGRIVERFGPLRFSFTLPVSDGGLEMILERWSIGPLPLPRSLAPRIEAREWDEEGRFHFDVAVSLPVAGPIVRYRGWLVP